MGIAGGGPSVAGDQQGASVAGVEGGEVREVGSSAVSLWATGECVVLFGGRCVPLEGLSC